MVVCVGDYLMSYREQKRIETVLITAINKLGTSQEYSDFVPKYVVDKNISTDQTAYQIISQLLNKCFSAVIWTDNIVFIVDAVDKRSGVRRYQKEFKKPLSQLSEIISNEFVKFNHGVVTESAALDIMEEDIYKASSYHRVKFTDKEFIPIYFSLI